MKDESLVVHPLSLITYPSSPGYVNKRSLPITNCFSGRKAGVENGRFWKKSGKKLGGPVASAGWLVGLRNGGRGGACCVGKGARTRRAECGARRAECGGRSAERPQKDGPRMVIPGPGRAEGTQLAGEAGASR